MARTMQPKVKAEYKAFLPERTPEEFVLLRRSIIEDGIRDPIVLTDDGFIVDGYGRWEIAKELKLKVKTFVKEFKDDDAVYTWMAANQFGKRNLTKEQRDYYMGVRAAQAITSHGGNRRSSGSNVNLKPETVETIANEADIGEKMVRENAKFAAGVDTLPPEERAKVLAGKSDLTKKKIIELAPVRCDKCTRLKVEIKDCPQCAVVQAAYKAKKLSKKSGGKNKSGSMKFDWAKFKTQLGLVARAADRIADGYTIKKNQGDHKIAVDLLGEYVDHMTSWEKSLTKGA